MFDLIDDIFNESFFWNMNRRDASDGAPRQNRQISSNSFPPTNISINPDTKVLSIQAALAGVEEEWINLTFNSDQLKLVVKVPQTTKPEEKPEVKKDFYLQTGLKTFSELETAWNIDTRYFDRDKVDVKYKNGLLQITIPPRDEVKPKNIPIFGKLKLEEKTE